MFGGQTLKCCSFVRIFTHWWPPGGISPFLIAVEQLVGCLLYFTSQHAAAIRRTVLQYLFTWEFRGLSSREMEFLWRILFGDTHCLNVWTVAWRRGKLLFSYCSGNMYSITACLAVLFVQVPERFLPKKSVHHQFSSPKQRQFVHAPLNTTQGNYFT